MVLTQYTRRARRGGLQEERHSIKTKGKMLVTRKSSSMTRGDHKMHKLYRISNACADRWKGKWTHREPPWSTFLLSSPWCWPLQHVELDEPASKDGQRPDDAHGHEHAEQDVIQHHGDKFPLLCRLELNTAFIKALEILCSLKKRDWDERGKCPLV